MYQNTNDKREVVEKYFDMVSKLALSQTKSKDLADDVVQEVFIRFLKAKKTFESDQHIKAWLIRVTINCCHNVFSSSWAKKTVPLSEEIPFSTEEKGEVYYAVLELPRKYKAVIHLFYYEEMSIAEISEALKINPSTVKSQLSRARKILREKLKGGCELV